MKKLLIIPALLLAFNPLIASSVVEEQATVCISENGSNLQALESCMSKLYVPASMDCDELLEVHRSILVVSQGNSSATIRNAARVSSKLAIISLSANCYSPDVAARLVARIGSEVGGSNTSIIADAIVSGAVDAAAALGVDSGSLASSATSTGGIGGAGGSAGTGATSVAVASAPAVQVFYDSDVVVSPSDL